jgi:hypothetical protein
MLIVVIAIILLVAGVIAATLGVGAIAVLPVAIGVIALLWGIALAVRRRPPGAPARSPAAGRPELLGPGGADDPDRPG